MNLRKPPQNSFVGLTPDALMPVTLKTPRKRDRRGGWNAKRPLPDDAVNARAEASQNPVTFINSLKHTKGASAGQSFQLRKWQLAIVKELFRRKKDGSRQYRTCLLMLPRKNGKSELAAAIALYGLLADGEAGAEVYSAASDRDQASLVFNVAAQMVKNDPVLNEACYIIETQKRILHRSSGSFYKALSADAHNKHGFNASLIVYDELHTAPNRDLYDVLSTSMGARANPLMLVITTAGYDKHSILWELYSHAKKVQENPAIDPSFLPILYEAPPTADWTSPKVWKACNPALGDFRSLTDMQIACDRAKAIPAQENNFRRLYLNQWTEQDARWLSLTAWDACQTAYTRASLRGRRCYVGMDLATTTDLGALVAVFPGDGGFDVLAQFFVPADRLQKRARTDHVPYDEWARQGQLTATPGAVVDYDVVRMVLQGWAKEFDLQLLAFDPWNATDLTTRLAQQDGIPCVQIRQGFASLSAPTKSLEAAVLSGRLRHDGHPVLRWNIGNVAVETDAAGNLKPSKVKSTERIDGVVALIMAVDLLDRMGTQVTPSYAMEVG